MLFRKYRGSVHEPKFVWEHEQYASHRKAT
jgi:hypothetical protein